MAYGKSHNALKMGRFGTIDRSNIGQKYVFSKSGGGPFGTLKQVFLAHFKPVVTHLEPKLTLFFTFLRPFFGPSKVPKACNVNRDKEKDISSNLHPSPQS